MILSLNWCNLFLFLARDFRNERKGLNYFFIVNIVVDYEIKEVRFSN
jgi:hypothetical protein